MQCFYLFCVMSICAAFSFKLKNIGKNMYVSVDINNKSKAKVSNELNGTVFDYTWNSTTNKYAFLKMNNEQKMALQYNEKNDVLELTNFSKIVEQTFDFVPVEIINNAFFIVHKRKCLTWDEVNNKFSLRECNESNLLQKFNIEEKDLITDDLEIFNNHNDIFEVETVHLTQLYDPNKKNLHQLNGIEVISEISQMHMENDARDIIQNIYKLFYDLTSCFVNKKVCTIGGIDLHKAKKFVKNYKSTAFKTKEYNLNNKNTDSEM